jgi:hypothetical protein
MNEDTDLSKTLQSSSTRIFTAVSSLDARNKNQSDGEAKKPPLIVHRQCTIQLKTVPDGYNFGRIYYLKANLDTPDRLIITHLSDAATKAKGKAERKSKLQESQDMMRKINKSLAFQVIVAVLILLVCAVFIVLLRIV